MVIDCLQWVLLAENLNDFWRLPAGTLSQTTVLFSCEEGLQFCGENSA